MFRLIKVQGQTSHLFPKSQICAFVVLKEVGLYLLSRQRTATTRARTVYDLQLSRRLLLLLLLCHAPVIAAVTVLQLVQDDGVRVVMRVVVHGHSPFIEGGDKPVVVYDLSAPVLSPLAPVLH